MIIDYDLIALAIGTVSIVAGLLGMWIEGRRTRIVSQATLSVSLEERFNGPEIRAMRRVAAQKLKEERAGSVIVEFNETLDFFSLVAALVEGQAVSFELSYRLYSYWWIRYWCAGQRYIEWYRESSADPSAWESVQRLANRIERQMAKSGEPLPSESELQRFLAEESCC